MPFSSFSIHFFDVICKGIFSLSPIKNLASLQDKAKNFLNSYKISILIDIQCFLIGLNFRQLKQLITFQYTKIVHEYVFAAELDSESPCCNNGHCLLMVTFC